MNAKEFLQSYRNSLLASQVSKDEIEVIEAKMGASSPKLDKVGTSQISAKSKLDIYGNRYHDLLEQLIGFQRIETDRLTEVLKVINKINDGEIKTLHQNDEVGTDCEGYELRYPSYLPKAQHWIGFGSGSHQKSVKKGVICYREQEYQNRSKRVRYGSICIYAFELQRADRQRADYRYRINARAGR